MTNRWIQICNLGPDAAVGDWSAVDPSVFLSVCVCVLINPVVKWEQEPRYPMRGNLLVVRDWGSARLEILEQLLLYWHHYFLSLSLSLSARLPLSLCEFGLILLKHCATQTQTHKQSWRLERRRQRFEDWSPAEHVRCSRLEFLTVTV